MRRHQHPLCSVRETEVLGRITWGTVAGGVQDAPVCLLHSNLGSPLPGVQTAELLPGPQAPPTMPVAGLLLWASLVTGAWPATPVQDLPPATPRVRLSFQGKRPPCGPQQPPVHGTRPAACTGERRGHGNQGPHVGGPELRGGQEVGLLGRLGTEPLGHFGADPGSGPLLKAAGESRLGLHGRL